MSIHRKTGCPNVLALSRDPERRIDILSGPPRKGPLLREALYEGSDRRGLLSDVAKAITDTGTDISTPTCARSRRYAVIVVEVRDLAHLEKGASVDPGA